MFENLFSTTTATTTTKPKTKMFEGIFDAVKKPVLLSPKDERKEKVKSLQNEMLASGQATTAPLLSLPQTEKKTPFVSGLEEGFFGGLKAIGKTFVNIPKRYVKEAVMPILSYPIEKTKKDIEILPFLPKATKETLQSAIGYTPISPEEPFSKQPLWKKITDVVAEVNPAILTMGKETLKSSYGFLASAITPQQEEVKIPFTKETAPTFLKTYNDGRKAGLSPLWATILITSRAAGDVLITSNILETVGKIPVGKVKTITLTRSDLIDITRGEEFAGKIEPAKLEAYKQLTREGINFTKMLKEAGKIDIKTGAPKTLGQLLEEQASAIWQDEAGFIKTPFGEKTGKEIVEFKEKPLAQEASKLRPQDFSSADEFRKAQGTPIYHGTSLVNAESINKGGFSLKEQGFSGKPRGAGNQGEALSLSKKQSVSELHAIGSSKGGKGGTVLPTYLDRSAKIFSTNNIPKEWIGKEPTLTQLDVYARTNGFDGIDLAKLEEDGIIRGGRIGVKEYEVTIFNPNILKTKSQLDRIWNDWNEANKGVGEVKSTKTLSSFDVVTTQYPEELKKLFTETEVKFIANPNLFIEEKAYGTYKNALIQTVLTNGKVQSRTLYHEAFHAYLDLFVNQGKRQEILKLVRERYNLRTLSQAEEKLAEDFADYMNTKKTWSAKLKDFFVNIINHLRKIIGKESQVLKLFKDIKTRQRPTGKIEPSGIIKFKKTEKDFRNFNDINNYIEKHGEELSDTELMEYNEIADELYKAEEEEAYRQTFGDIKNVTEFYGETKDQYQNFKNIIKDLYGSMKKFIETAEDAASVENLAEKKGLTNKLNNSLYSQEKTNNEIMDEFKNAIMKEYGYGKTKATIAEKLYTPVKSLKSQKGAFDRMIKQFLLKKAPQLETDFLYSLKKEYRRNLDAKALLKYGEEGKQIYNKIKSAETWSVKNEADAIVRLDDPFKKLTKEDFTKFGDYVEGKISIPENAIEAVNEWKKIANEIGYKAKNYKVMIRKLDGTEKPFIPIKNYYPYFVKEEELTKIFADQTKYRNFLEDMAMENDITVAEAHRIIQKMVNGRADFYGHLERSRESRLPKEFYERDPRNILAQYIHGAYQRLGIIREFGAEDKGLQKIIQTALQNGEDFEEIQLLTARALGRENFNKDLIKISNFARMYQNITKLSLVAIANIADISKSFVRTNFFSAVKGLVKSFTKEGKIFSRKAGVLDTQLYDYAKEHHLGTMFFKYTGFKWTETEVRRVMALSSKNYVELLYKKLIKNPNNAFVKRRLEQFNLDPDELLKKGLKENDLITAAIKAIADSQPVSKLDMPYRWQSPTGKTLTQYKQFAYKQWQFTKEFIFREASKGNFKPLLLFLLIGAGLGELIGDLKAWVRGGRKRPEDLPHRIIDNLMTIGGLGLATDFLTNLQYGSYGGGFTKFIVGPTISDIDAWATAIQGDINTIMTDNKFIALRSPNKGERQVKIAKKLLYSLPFFGPALANKLFPTRSEYKARTIPIAEEILQLMEEEQQGVIKPNILKPNISKPNILKPNK